MEFKLHSDYSPRGDQGRAIEQLINGVTDAEKHQVLLGVTGSGKTFTMAKVIEAVESPRAGARPQQDTGRPALPRIQALLSRITPSNILSRYYDYYQPEAYIPAGDVYIEKEATINDELDKLRLSATKSLFERREESSWRRCRAFTVWGRQKRTTACCCSWKRDRRSSAKTSCANWWKSFMSAMIPSCGAEHFAYAVT